MVETEIPEGVCGGGGGGGGGRGDGGRGGGRYLMLHCHHQDEYFCFKMVSDESPF